MTTPLLTTKLCIPPPRPNLVPRPRLIERLNAGLHRKLTPMRSIGLIIRPGRLWQDDAGERIRKALD
jgi:LuxR family maltose regulon positive regulatory protein